MRNQNGYGSVYKLKGKRRNPWTARVEIGKKVASSGRVYPDYHYIGYYRTRAQAQNALADWHTSPKDRDMSKRITLESVYERWSAENLQNVSHDKLYRYTYSWSKLQALHHVDINDINIDMIEKVLHDPRFTRTTQRHCKTTLKALYKYAAKHEWVTKDKAEIMSLITVSGTLKKQRQHERIPNEEITRIHHDSSDVSEVIIFMLYTGLRISELCNVRCDDVNIEERFFCVRDSKTTAGIREVPIHDKLLSTVEKWLRNDSDASDQLIAHISKQNKRVSHSALRDQMQKLYGEDFLPHNTRVTFISRMQELKPAPSAVVLKSIVGHKSNDVTVDVYTRISIDEKLKWINRLEWLE